jgi:hypothetical protein
MDPATEPQAPATGANGPAPGTNGPGADVKRRNVKFPIALRININAAMAASLQRISQYREMPEGIVCREILKQYLLQADPEYRRAIIPNTENQQHG